MTEITFKNRKLNIEKLFSFGFIHTDNEYLYHTDLLDGQIKMTVQIDADGKIFPRLPYEQKALDNYLP